MDLMGTKESAAFYTDKILALWNARIDGGR